MTCFELALFIKELLITSSALAGVVVAIYGLTAWKKQLKGKVEYDLARRILITLYKYRDAIAVVRNPAIWSNEFKELPESINKNLTEEQIRFERLNGVYEARWAKVQIEKAALYADLIESEATWGLDLNELFKKVFKLEQQLLQGIRAFLSTQNPDENSVIKELAEENIRKDRWILHARISEADTFEHNLVEAISEIEAYLKPHIWTVKNTK